MAEAQSFPNTPLEQARASALALRQTASLARALAGAGRAIDLTGLDGQVGLLCARSLDLPPQEGRAFSQELEVLLTELEDLATVMRLPPAPS